MGEELWFYYSGINHRFTQKEGYRGGIHLARLRRDGFVSFRGDDRGGFVETREVRFDGRRLFLNADAEKGEIRVEVLERRGRTVLEDWSREQAQPWTGDHLQAEVRWQGQSSLEPLRGQTVRFRLLPQERGPVLILDRKLNFNERSQVAGPRLGNHQLQVPKHRRSSRAANGLNRLQYEARVRGESRTTPQSYQGVSFSKWGSSAGARLSEEEPTNPHFSSRHAKSRKGGLFGV